MILSCYGVLEVVDAIAILLLYKQLLIFRSVYKSNERRRVIVCLMPGFHHSVAVLPLPFRRQPLPFPYTVAVAVATALAYLYVLARRRRRLAGQLLNGTTENRTRYIATEERLR